MQTKNKCEKREIKLDLIVMCRERTLHLFKPMEYLQKIIMYWATKKSIQLADVNYYI